jgi:TPR repeat protein
MRDRIRSTLTPEEMQIETASSTESGGNKMNSRVLWFAITMIAASACSATSPDSEKAARAAELYQQTFGAENPSEERMPEAFRLWSSLAEEGHPQSMYYLSGAYFDGIPNVVERDSAEALAMLRAAAERGVPQAQFDLAWQLESGMHTPPDLKAALKFYEQAASNGYALAISRLVRVYSQGELGQPRDLKRAEDWRRRSPRFGVK